MFVRSMAARDRLGGLADLCAAATVLMRALYDVVLVETVGVGPVRDRDRRARRHGGVRGPAGLGRQPAVHEGRHRRDPRRRRGHQGRPRRHRRARPARPRGPLGWLPGPASGGRRCCWSRRRAGRGSTPRWTPSTATAPGSPATSPAGARRRRDVWLERWRARGVRPPRCRAGPPIARNRRAVSLTFPTASLPSCSDWELRRAKGRTLSSRSCTDALRRRHREGRGQLLGLRARPAGLRGNRTDIAAVEAEIERAIQFHVEGLEQTSCRCRRPARW